MNGFSRPGQSGAGARDGFGHASSGECRTGWMPHLVHEPDLAVVVPAEKYADDGFGSAPAIGAGGIEMPIAGGMGAFERSRPAPTRDEPHDRRRPKPRAATFIGSETAI